MDLIQFATLTLGIGFALVVAAAVRRRQTAELRARVLEMIGTAARRGLPLAPALRRMGRSTPGAQGRTLEDLADRLDSGGPLAAALEAALPAGTIPAELLATIGAAEGTAALQPTLERLADRAGRVQRTQDRIATALAYPSLLALGLVGTYATTDSLLAQLPEQTRGGDLTGLATHALAIALWTALTLAMIAQSTGWHGRLHGTLLALAGRLPGLGELLRVDAAARVLRIAGSLSTTGLPLGEILRRAAHATRHGGIRHGMLRAARAADEGSTPPEVWQSAGLPDFAVAFATLAVGASPDEIGRRLHAAAAACERRVARRLGRTLGLVQPAAIAALGLMIALHFGMVVEHLQSSRLMQGGGSPW